ncbi:MAG TPA: hypothetical protein VG537_04000, partial [Candidatus Kapabacteria bacterium]|nr:hypothetical protein [Candidatus Kapabacteria bacterium]
MPILTSILLVLTGLALISLALRARPAKRERRRSDYSERKLELAAQICEASARDAFDVELDHTDASLVTLDAMIAEEWRESSDNNTNEKLLDELYVLGAYVGDVLVRHHSAEWHMKAASLDKGSGFVRKDQPLLPEIASWPCLYFNDANLIASPFEMVEHKLREPKTFRIMEAVERLLAEVERKKNVRATTWHRTGEPTASFSSEESSW